MEASQSGSLGRYAWRDAFLRHLRDGLIVASAVSLAVIGIAVFSETVPPQAVVGIVVALYGLGVLFAAAASLFVRLVARAENPPKGDLDVKKSKAV
ncbi:hypothetical protein E6Q11_06120 [Candidatus Dojkabacteria bacterium]|jgi:hypothetical protein|uniref:Uncharacterized protein n=1 Tax=Candidatus Dojkabacteria bacterium TaxID=2099670 RepID=A0A5C7J329_9BACT|nr:MAG: hypothetical protein E6Q11_06120 [Candidatus Dojkabacteria bacterium]